MIEKVLALSFDKATVQIAFLGDLDVSLGYHFCIPFREDGGSSFMRLAMFFLLLVPRLSFAGDEMMNECLSKFRGYGGPAEAYSRSYCDCLSNALNKGPEAKVKCEKEFYQKNDFFQLCEIRTKERLRKGYVMPEQQKQRQAGIIKETCSCQYERAARHEFTWSYASSKEAEKDKVECDKKTFAKFRPQKSRP